MIWIAPSEEDTNAALRGNANRCRKTTWRDVRAAQDHRSNNMDAAECIHDLAPQGMAGLNAARKASPVAACPPTSPATAMREAHVETGCLWFEVNRNALEASYDSRLFDGEAELRFW